MKSNSVKPVLAVDLGGTKIRSAIVPPDGKIFLSNNYLTEANKGTETVVRKIIFAIEDIMMKAESGIKDFGGLAIAAAGILDTNKGAVTASPSLPGWRDVPLKSILENKFGIDVLLINDASAAALGEYYYGAGKNVQNLIYLTVSTGIGGGIIIDGKLYAGVDGCAGEIGHMVIESHGTQCNCGNYGCLEILASGTAIAKEAQRRINEGEESSLIDLTKNIPGSITSETVALAARGGDTLACEVINRAANYLGIGIANLINIFNPEMIIVGGGVSKMGEMLLEPIRNTVIQRAFYLPAKTARIVRSVLGDDAGILGAAVTLFTMKL